MRIIFLGTPEFAAYSLSKLHQSGRNIVAVITAPDRKAGRGQKLNYSAVKKYAVEQGIDCLQPGNLKDPNFLEQLKSYRADLQIVVAFRMLPKIVWDMPEHGTMNLHASLLPKYRGAAPINWAIINGEKKSGLTTFFLKHEIDTGAILLRKEVDIAERETAGSLHDKLMIRGPELLIESLDSIESGTYVLREQKEFLEKGQQLEDLPTAPKIFREDCKIDWSKSSIQIDRFIRGLSPYPAAWTKLLSKKSGKSLTLKIYDCKPVDNDQRLKPAEIKQIDQDLFIGCKERAIKITELQLEGKRRMRVNNFLNGINLEDYENHLT